jgi:hypothetical protein
MGIHPAGMLPEVFEGCAHAPIYENVEEFNEKTLGFLKRHERAVTTGPA